MMFLRTKNSVCGMHQSTGIARWGREEGGSQSSGKSQLTLEHSRTSIGTGGKIASLLTLGTLAS